MITNWTKVFTFTLRNRVCKKGYLTATLCVMLVLLIVIPAVMLLADHSTEKNAVKTTDIAQAVCVGDMPLEAIGSIQQGVYGNIEYTAAADLDTAQSICASRDNSVIVLTDDTTIHVLLPEGSSIDNDDATSFGEYLCTFYPYLAAVQSGVDFAELEIPAYASGELITDSSVGADTAREVLSTILPYLLLMLLYFMVLIYGQGVAASVILEKTSKLMDLFLVSIKPAALALGKTLAIALAGFCQMILWLASAAGGLALGSALIHMTNPGSTLGLLQLMDALGGIGGIITPSVAILTALLLVFGFLLYCALAALGGALASKPEDLSVTNIFFSLILVVSFFVCIFGGEQSGMISTNPILAFIPFTAPLVVPGRLLLGTMSTLDAVVSVGITAVFAFALVLLAGRIYTQMAFYRGKAMNPLMLLKQRRMG